MEQFRIKKAFTIAMVMIGVWGCSSGPKVQEFPDTANSADEVQRLSTDMQTAMERQVDVLAPSSFRKASAALASSKELQQEGKDTKKILHRVAEGRSYLNRANQFAELSHKNIEEVVIARKAAIAAGGPKYFPDDFNKADDHLQSLTSNIEENDLGEVAESRGKLQKEYLDVELKAIKHTNLAPARAAIAQAKTEGAETFAKQSLAIAEKKVSDTEAFIVANRHETDVVASRSEDALKAASHLLKITRASKMSKNLTPEQIALRLDEQRRQTEVERGKLAEEKNAGRALAVETRGLKSEQEFQRRFEAARAKFTEEEAEVYRQGNRLVIRLRGLEFPVAQSVLRGSNFPLLAKVGKAVQEFDNCSVVVEGHTDSDGGKVLNDQLSKERAQAVSEYLVSSEVIDRANVSAVGYGFERPLADNKTLKGKAQNRRVDVIINSNMAAE